MSSSRWGSGAEALKRVTPGFVKELYRDSRRAVRKIFWPGDRVVTCRVRNAMIRIGVSSDVEQFRADSYRTKEPETLDWLDENLRDRDTFYDVGANIGLYALYAGATKPLARVYAFEPAAANLWRLCSNIALNRLTNVIPCGFALSDTERFDRLYLSDLQPGSALHGLGGRSEHDPGQDDPACAQGAITVTLDALVLRHRLPIPTLIKIDVDGHEDRILTGGEATLRQPALRSILVELSSRNDTACPEAERGLVDAGFRCVRKSEWVWRSEGVECRNYVFMRSDAEATSSV